MFSTGLVCGRKKASAPFKKLLGKQDFLFGKKYIPADFVFPDDPSHLNVKQARQFLEHIHKHQRKAPDDVFRFRYWLNNEGELADPVLPSPEVSEVEGDEAEGSEAEDGSAEDDGAETVMTIMVKHKKSGREKVSTVTMMRMGMVGWMELRRWRTCCLSSIAVQKHRGNPMTR